MSQLVAGTTEHTAPANRVYFPALDGIRAMAFLLVFLDHYASLPWGWTGVNIFFVLSGFLITGILFDTRDNPHPVRNFYVRRTLRIFPLYYGIFLVLFILAPIAHWQWNREWWAWLFYVGNFLRFTNPGPKGSLQQYAADAQLHGAVILYLSPIWSLCVEEQFYLIWPWIIFRIRSMRTILWICVVTVAVIPVFRTVTSHHAPKWMLDGALLYNATPFQIDALLLGALLAILWRGAHRKIILTIARIVTAALTIAVFAYFIFFVHIFRPSGFSAYTYPAWWDTWGFSLVNIYAGALIVCALHPNSITYRICNLRGLRWIGRISYGAYMFHDIFHDIFVKAAKTASSRLVPLFAHPVQLTIALALPATLLMAAISFRFFETPFLNLKERWTR